MKLLLDDANIQHIEEAFHYYPMDGVTTNPTILAKTNQHPISVLDQIRNSIGNEKQLHIQVLAKDVQGMVKDAKALIQRYQENTLIKIPATKDGLVAIAILKEMEIPTTATAIYTPMQAYLAAKAGATYVAPYVNRIDQLGYHGIETTLTIHQILNANQYPTQILAASFKNTQQVQDLCQQGIDMVTVPFDLLDQLAINPIITSAVEKFHQDFYDVFETVDTFYDLLK